MTLPAIFFGHGNPMNALQANAYTEGWRRFAQSIPKPRAILCVSAHWYLPRTAVTAMDRPRTIHDFGGFPQALRDVRYPAPGSPELAGRVAELLPSVPVFMDHEWGLDHGTWSVLVHAYPEADVPVVQLGIDETKEPAWHFKAAQGLRALRDEGVLVMGSGNLVHNLHAYAWGRHVPEPYDWALRFETRAREWLQRAEFAPLVDYESIGRDATLSAPTPEHYLPLVYCMGLHRPGEPVSFPVEGFDGGSISMLSVRFG
ncbi:MAG TPA: 4,5-DOPA dioxygenase extradiol [Usitatibacter sp.]|jgi:4,5-DOPA dioxygenase extradiol|nr:4,5-DOPA dioxygenase extradiol [Usitatibacter sp.]